jgi:hypothetical protein
VSAIKTNIRENGLRYASKAATVTEFPGAPGATLSCFLCGRHLPRSTLSSFVLAGTRQYRCRGGCTP